MGSFLPSNDDGKFIELDSVYTLIERDFINRLSLRCLDLRPPSTVHQQAFIRGRLDKDQTVLLERKETEYEDEREHETAYT